MILTTIDQFKEVVPTAADVEDFADLKPYCNSAELWLKNKILGTTLYNFIDALEAPAGTDVDLQALCFNIIGNHAYWDAIPFLDLVHTNAGFGVIQNANKVPASKERVERLRQQCLIRRDNEVENLITFLEQNNTYHENWKGSPVYSILTDCLISTADQLQRFANWEGTRKDFLVLKPKLFHFTVAKLQPLFSKDLIEMLIEKQRDGDLTADESSLIDLLKHSLGSLVNENEKVASQIAADALRFIDEKIESFTTYTASQEYIARNTAGYINELESPIFSSIW